MISYTGVTCTPNKTREALVLDYPDMTDWKLLCIYESKDRAIMILKYLKTKERVVIDIPAGGPSNSSWYIFHFLN